MAQLDYSIGVDLGGTNIKMLAVDPDGKVIEEAVHPTQDRSELKSVWKRHIKETVLAWEEKLGLAHAIGVSAPGMPNPNKRSILSLPGRLEGLEGLDWTEYLEKSQVVPVINDAHAALYGESWLGGAADVENAIFITLGTGVGGAFTYKGKLQEGSLGRAGHFGHTCLDPDGELDIKNSPGSIELKIGECTILERTQGKFKSTLELVEAYKSGDLDATRYWTRSVYYLACALATYINILDPEIILLGGGISKAGDSLMKPLKGYLNRVEWRPGNHQVKIDFAQLGNQAGALGAVRYANEYVNAAASTVTSA